MTGWPTHAHDCAVAEMRQRLYRVGRFLQEAFFIIRQHVFEGYILKLENEDGKLKVHWNMSPDENIRAHFGLPECYKHLSCIWPFGIPDGMAVSDGEKLAVMAYSGSDRTDLAFALTHSLARFLLDGESANPDLSLEVSTSP